MKNEKTRKLVVSALLTGITFLLGLTIVGYIPNPFNPTVSMTLLCLPVIIGTVTEGLKTGIVISLFFGATSLLKALGVTMVPDPLGTYLLGISVWRTVIIIFIPRLIIPFTTWAVYKAISGESVARKRIATGVAAFIGSMTNTVLFLSAIYLLFLPEIGELSAAFETTPELFARVLAVIGAINGLPEAAVAVLLCVPIVAALSQLKQRQIDRLKKS